MKFFKYCKPWYLVAVVVVVGLIYCQVSLDLMLPDYSSEIVEIILLRGSSSKVWEVFGKMILVCLGSTVCVIGTGYISAVVGAGLSKNLRAGVFKKVQSFSMEEINKFSTSSLITRSTNDIQQIQNVVVMSLRIAITAPITCVKAVVKMVGKSSQLSWITVVAILLMLALLAVIFFLVVPKFTKIQKLTDKLNSVTRENLTGLRVVRAFNGEEYQEQKSEVANSELTKTNVFTAISFSFLGPAMNLIMMGLSLAISWVGAYLINGNLLELPTLTAFSNYALKVLTSFMMIAVVFVFIPRGIVAFKRVMEILKTESKITDGAGKVEGDVFVITDETKGIVCTQQKQSKVEFKNVSFKYPDANEYVLHNISFEANAGETVAFIGSTGSGKSTLINLIPRFYDATEGEVLVDGVNVKDYTLEDLHKKIGYVPQKGVLFSGTVKENLMYGNENATDDEISEFVRIAQAGFVNKLEGGLEYNVAQGATNLSGGQKQRLSIARALITKPNIYIYDDSFSALDYKTDKALRKQLKKLNGLNLIVAQRIGTIIDADQIIVLDEGKMVGKGTHKELLKNCKVYQEIAYSQLSKEEL